MTDKGFDVFIMAAPRRVEDIFDESDLRTLAGLGRLTIHREDAIDQATFEAKAAGAHLIMGQFDLPAERLDACPNLRAVINVEGNFLPNIDYAHCFRRGIRVLSVSQVFAEPVAEAALGMAIDLGRGISRLDRLFRQGREPWGLEANRDATTLFRAPVGLIGFGDLGRALLPLLRPFGCDVGVYDPWLPAAYVEAAGCRAVSLEALLSTSLYVFVLAAVTADNRHFLKAEHFATMRPGASLLLMSRAGVVDFPAMVAAARSGRIRVATDVFPQEPAPADEPARQVDAVLLSPHAAGALPSVLARIGKDAVGDACLIARGLPPVLCKRAEPETAGLSRSRPVDRS